METRHRAALLLSVVLLAVSGCGQEGPTPEIQASSPAMDPSSPAMDPEVARELAEQAEAANLCAERWDEVREEVRSTGQRDGEARRQADAARAACEEELTGQPFASSSPALTECSRAPAVAGFADVAANDTGVHIFARCSTYVSDSWPFPLFALPLPDETDHSVATLADAYLDGLSAAHDDQGYELVVGNQTPFEAERDGRSVVVSWSREDAEMLGIGATGTRDTLTAELGSLFLQLEDVDGVEFAVEGSCEAFAELAAVGTRCLPPVTRGSAIGDGPEVDR
jgi:hypothetical protein